MYYLLHKFGLNNVYRSEMGGHSGPPLQDRSFNGGHQKPSGEKQVGPTTGPLQRWEEGERLLHWKVAPLGGTVKESRVAGGRREMRGGRGLRPFVCPLCPGKNWGGLKQHKWMRFPLFILIVGTGYLPPR